ncbi:hypothetical protein BDV93DRAFT_511870 [Ceratobasidium sp. AG-I]|nr:hypothetical protein BDV93DRAFT_511870 [Ceratobasidium sp. AG-I]
MTLEDGEPAPKQHRRSVSPEPDTRSEGLIDPAEHDPPYITINAADPLPHSPLPPDYHCPSSLQGPPARTVESDGELEFDELGEVFVHNIGQDGFDLNNELYDEYFGLPDGENQSPEAALPVFQLELDDEFEATPDDDPDDEGDDGAQCAAFAEHKLIRNAYIDAFVQKSLYGATHRALKHQLKAARRTIATHPDVSAEDITHMAQSIGTAER